jgi:hypothetical protein
MKKIIIGFGALILVACASQGAVSQSFLKGGNLNAGYDCVINSLSNKGLIASGTKSSLSGSSMIKVSGKMNIPYSVTFQKGKNQDGSGDVVRALFEYQNPDSLNSSQFNAAVQNIKNPWEDALIECSPSFR